MRAFDIKQGGVGTPLPLSWMRKKRIIEFAISHARNNQNWKRQPDATGIYRDIVSKTPPRSWPFCGTRDLDCLFGGYSNSRYQVSSSSFLFPQPFVFFLKIVSRPLYFLFPRCPYFLFISPSVSPWNLFRGPLISYISQNHSLTLGSAFNRTVIPS